MPRKPINFELDFMIKDIFPRFTVKQFDDVSFNIKPLNQGLDYDTTGMTGKIFVGVNNDMFMQTTNITVSSNNINVLLDKNMLQKSGRAYAEIELTDKAGTITSSSFIFDIDPKIGEGGQIPGEYEGFVEKYERLISEFKSQVSLTINNCNNKVNTTINNCNTNVNNKLSSVDSVVNIKISDFEKRFNRLTSSQQQSAEVIDARVDFKGVAFDSLKERIDCTDKLLRDSTVSTVTTESDFTTVEETSNGYFEDVKLEGRTLVNHIRNWKVKGGTLPTIINGSFENDFTTNSAVMYCEIKTGVSTLICDVKTADNRGLVISIFSSLNDIGQTTNFLMRLNVNNNYIQKLDIPSDAKYLVIQRVDGNTGIATVRNLMLLEGDHTQNPPSCFEGLKSVGQDVDEVSVESVNENLLCNSTLEVGGFVTSNPFNELNGGEYDAQYRRIRIKLDRGTYVLKSNSQHQILCRCFYEGCTVLPFADSTVIYVKENNTLVKISFKEKNNAVWTFGETTDDIKLMLNKGDIAQPYIPHQSDKKPLLYYNPTTETWEKPILRQWDSIEKHSDGKYYYHKRSGEVVLNGSENWTLYSNGDASTNYIGFRLTKGDVTGIQLQTGIRGISDKFNYIESYTELNQGLKEGLYCGYNAIVVGVNRTKLSTQDVEGFKQWLQANPTTVVYQLAQEEVYECTNIDLITYANETNYIVNCGAIAPKSILKVHNNISNVVKILQEKVSLLESNVKASQEVQDMMILESDMRILDIELALMEHTPITLNLGKNTMLRSATYFNFIKNHIINETYEKEYLENVINKYLATNRLTQEEYDELYKLLYPPVYDIELPIEE